MPRPKSKCALIESTVGADDGLVGVPPSIALSRSDVDHELLISFVTLEAPSGPLKDAAMALAPCVRKS